MIKDNNINSKTHYLFKSTKSNAFPVLIQLFLPILCAAIAIFNSILSALKWENIKKCNQPFTYTHIRFKFICIVVY